MRNILIVSALLIFTLSLHANSAKGTLSKNHLSPSVQKIISSHNLKVVNYDYVNALVENKEKKVLIVDGRPNKKYLAGHIYTAISLPIAKFEANINKMDNIDKNREIITYCGGYSCNKSSQLAIKLAEKGFNNVKVYSGGMPEWRGKNYVIIETPSVLSTYKKNSALLVDARPYKMYIAGTIPGALSISDTQVDELSGRFPRDKSTQIITFCGGHKCFKSHKIAKIMVNDGYTNVKVYAAGLPEWKKSGCLTTSRKISLPSEKSKNHIVLESGIVAGEDEGTVHGEWFKSQLGKLPTIVQLVDVRPISDFEEGHIDGAISLYAEDMTAKEFFAALPKGKTIVFSCASGGRALESWMKLNDKKLDVSSIFYFDANINCEKNKCEIEANEPLGD